MSARTCQTLQRQSRTRKSSGAGSANRVLRQWRNRPQRVAATKAVMAAMIKHITFNYNKSQEKARCFASKKQAYWDMCALFPSGNQINIYLSSPSHSNVILQYGTWPRGPGHALIRAQNGGPWHKGGQWAASASMTSWGHCSSCRSSSLKPLAMFAALQTQKQYCVVEPTLRRANHSLVCVCVFLCARSMTVFAYRAPARMWAQQHCISQKHTWMKERCNVWCNMQCFFGSLAFALISCARARALGLCVIQQAEPEGCPHSDTASFYARHRFILCVPDKNNSAKTGML